MQNTHDNPKSRLLADFHGNNPAQLQAIATVAAIPADLLAHALAWRFEGLTVYRAFSTNQVEPALRHYRDAFQHAKRLFGVASVAAAVNPYGNAHNEALHNARMARVQKAQQEKLARKQAQSPVSTVFTSPEGLPLTDAQLVKLADSGGFVRRIATGELCKYVSTDRIKRGSGHWEPVTDTSDLP